MKHLLMATAAAIALAVAAPIATAQYTTPPPATAPYTTPIPDDPMTPQDESLSAQPNTMATQSQAQTATTPGTPELQDPAVTSATQPYDVQGQAGVGSAQAQTTTDVDSTMQAQSGTTGVDSTVQAQTYDSETQMGATSQSYGQNDTYASQSDSSSPTTLASLEQHARDAGMAGLPMTAMDVCAPREVSLTASGTRLSRDKEHQLINAADRASVCEFQRVVINSPNGRADQARRLLVEHGVDESLIEVQDTDTGGLEVEMHFAGIATSSEQYAQMFNTQQLASYQPNTASSYQPYADPSASAYQPSSAANSAPSTSSSTPDEGVWLGDPNVEVPQDPSTDGLSPTSGESAVAPEQYDI